MIRNPYLEKNINELSQKDSNVAIAGIVIDKDEGIFTLDDGSGQINILMDSDNLDGKEFIRVFGTVISLGNSLQVQGEVIQDLSKIDKLLYKKVKSLLNENQKGAV